MKEDEGGRRKTKSEWRAEHPVGKMKPRRNGAPVSNITDGLR